MGNSSFERIDDVLDHLAKEMDTSLKHIERRRNDRLETVKKHRLSDPSAAAQNNSWAQSKDFGDLFDRMNGRFETLAKRLRH